MNGRPLISYVIQTAKNSSFVPDVYVSTDSTEIADISMNYGAKIIERNESLAGDKVTLDPVIYDALIRCEKDNNCSYDVIITMQPTSPLTTVKTLDAAIQKFLEEHYNTLLSVVNRPHLCWTEKEGKVLPAYEKRLNRQQLPKNFLETGAFVIVDRKSISENSRFGENVGVFEVPEIESIDIDDATDWIMTESLMKKKKILFRVDGYVKLGMGHIYNCRKIFWMPNVIAI